MSMIYLEQYFDFFTRPVNLVPSRVCFCTHEVVGIAKMDLSKDFYGKIHIMWGQGVCMGMGIYYWTMVL